jgi:predicted O-linked N-acetylglucosamine transferase (SPINDLY family)
MAEAVAAFNRREFLRAVSICDAILSSDPNHFDAAHLAGLSWLRRGELVRAKSMLARAAAAGPANPDVHCNLAFVLHRLGKLDEAEAAARRALALAPALGEAHNNMANILKDTGRLDAAIQHYQLAVSASPNDPNLHANLGSALHLAGRLAEAEAAYRRGLALAPDFQDARIRLAILTAEQDRLAEAEEFVAAAERLAPRDAQVSNASGLIAMRRKNYGQAAASFRRAIEIDENFAGAWCNLGIALEELKDTEGAVDAYRRALTLDPAAVGAKRNLFKLYLHLDRCEPAYPLAIEFLGDPAIPPTFLPDLIGVFQRVCDFDCQDRAWARFREWLEEARVEPEALEPSLLLLNYPDNLAEDFVFSVHKRWGELSESPESRCTARVRPKMSEERSSGKLRVGYLSADLRRHSVGYFVQHVVANHDRRRFEVYCYSNAPATAEDDVTERIRSHADRFRRIGEVEDAAVASTIANDEIDILVDLAGHTRHNRIAVLARRPSPVQIAYLGYPNTTGASFLDYWVSDPYAHTSDDDRHTEKLLRLPECFLCFGELEHISPTSVLPAVDAGFVTFGSFNNPSKISRTTIRLWAEILRQVPGSRLLLKYRGLDAPVVRANLTKAFEVYGVETNRLVLEGHTADRSAHLDCYSAVDIALDSVPYNGTTTTCDALSMGVPVLTLAGKTHRQRASYSILKNLGLEEFVAWSEDEIVARAVELAGQLDRLASLRRSLRDRLRQSILCAPARFTRQLEGLYRRAWRECDCRGLNGQAIR